MRIRGTEAGEEIVGTDDADILDGGAGDDVILGLGGIDLIDGDAGIDRIEGGDGPDVLTGGPGRDLFIGTAAELHGDRITDFDDDRIVMRDASLDTIDILITSEAVFTRIDLVDKDGDPIAQITLDGRRLGTRPLDVRQTDQGIVIEQERSGHDPNHRADMAGRQAAGTGTEGGSEHGTEDGTETDTEASDAHEIDTQGEPAGLYPGAPVDASLMPIGGRATGLHTLLLDTQPDVVGVLAGTL